MPERYDLELGRCVQLGRRRCRILLCRRLDFSSLLKAGARAVVRIEDTQLLFHEMRMYQIELEMQAEQLQLAQMALNAERARYLDLYGFAPVGYCTITKSGLIVQSNLAAASILGQSGSALVGLPISRFVVPDDLGNFDLLRQQLTTTGQTQSCELRLLRGAAPPFWTLLAATVAQDVDGAPELRIMLSDINQLKQSDRHPQRATRTL